MLAEILERVLGPLRRRLRSSRGIAATAVTACALLLATSSSGRPANAFLTVLVISPALWWLGWWLAGVVHDIGEGLLRGATPDVRVGRRWQAGSTTAGVDLKQDAGARMFTDRGGILVRKRAWLVASGTPPIEIDLHRFSHAASLQRSHPQYMARFRERAYWWYEDAVYWTIGSYESADVKALLHAKALRHDRKLAHARALMAASRSPARRKREHIPREIKLAVWERDGGRCTQCDSAFDPQYDHVIPFSMGGSSTVENLQLLCARCNQSKGGRL
jgi:HNH endonuclease